jgi:carboxyl-terminal processing protease
MMKLLQRWGRRAAAMVLVSALGPSALAQTPITVVEYYNSVIASYFITGKANEQAALDTLPDFKRTGATFAASSATGTIPAGAQPICRHDVKLVPTFFSSHFYGLPSECATLQTVQLPNFIYEGLDFAVKIPNAAGVCPLDAPVVVRRAFRPETPVNAANHRYTTSLATYNAMISLGWNGEGPVYCVTSATDETPLPDLSADSGKRNLCEAPRGGINPRTGQAYPDVQGTRTDEKDWIRYWVDRSYLWYRELPNASTTASESVADYFKKLKAPTLAFSGGAKDRFSFSTSTANIDNTNAGITFGYGVKWAAIQSTPPREWIAGVVDQGSPAALAGVVRGDKIVSIDGVNFVSGSNANAINRGLFPPVVGESHSFVLQPANGAAQKTVSLTSASLPLISVPVSGTLNTPTGKVGYIAFTTFNSFTAEKAIADAIAGLAAEGISDLVLDLRYNSGGYLYISSQLAHMVAGASRTAGKVFERTLTNDKKPFGADGVFPFYTAGSGFAGGVTAGQLLPTLNLNRVFVLATGGSCSASEAFINALRGIDIPVIVIGEATCGKPYGFSGEDNCGTTYYPIQFTGVNAKGEGDYINGFAPTCIVPDDFTKSIGDPTEKQLAAALSYRTNGVCTGGTAVSAKKTARSDDASDGASAVGAEQRALEQMKLMTPRDVPSNAGDAVKPRAPKYLGETRN